MGKGFAAPARRREIRRRRAWSTIQSPKVDAFETRIRNRRRPTSFAYFARTDVADTAMDRDLKDVSVRCSSRFFEIRKSSGAVCGGKYREIKESDFRGDAWAGGGECDISDGWP